MFGHSGENVCWRPPACTVGAIVVFPFIAVVRRIARAQVEGLGADGVNVHQANGAAAGQVVPHLHFHVVPRFANDGHHWNWTPRPYADLSEAAALAERIRAALPR
jgi:histidine triad (HIT) family protein